MSLLARLAPHLPYVRRYARALTGDQATGDHYVRVALEALAAGERVLETSMTPRVALYHVFHAIWCTSGAQLESPQDDDSYADDTTRRLMRIAPRSRQAFLLTEPGFIERGRPFAVLFHGYVCDHVLDADTPRRPPPVADGVSAG